MNNTIMAIDAGKYMLKTLGMNVKDGEEDVKQVSFLSKWHTTNDINEEAEGNSYKVVFQDKITILGEAGAKHDFDSDKEKDLHKLCAYTAITKFLEPNTKDNHIYIVLACPIDFIRNKELKDSYKSFIKGNGEINITVNDNEYSFIIEDITIKSEGSGVIYNALEKFEDKEVAVIDLGGVNFSFTIYDDCVPIKDTRFARDIGGNKLNQMVRNELRDYTRGKQISRKVAEKALQDGYLTLLDKVDEDSKDIIKKVKKNYYELVIDEIKSAGYDLDSIKPVFCGGTAETIRETIDDKMKHAEVIKNAQWNAVQGLYVVANNKYSYLKTSTSKKNK